MKLGQWWHSVLCRSGYVIALRGMCSRVRPFGFRSPLCSTETLGMQLFVPLFLFFFFFFKILFIYLFIYLKRGREGERGEKHQLYGCLSYTPTGDLTCSPGMCPDWESNWQPFGSQAALSLLSHTSQGCICLFSVSMGMIMEATLEDCPEE